MRAGNRIAWVWLSAAAMNGGCGWSTESMMPAGVESVAVEAFANETFYRRSEITFTRELSRALVRRAGVMIREPEEAQAVIRGRILTIPRLTLVEDRNDRILEGGVIVSVEVRVEDPRTGAPIVPPFVVSRRAEYVVPRGESLQTAIDEAVKDCADDAVDQIEGHSFFAQRARLGS